MPKRRRAFGCTDTPHPSRATRDPPSPSRGEGAPPPNLPLQKGEGRIEYAGKPDLTPLLLPLFQGEAGWGCFCTTLAYTTIPVAASRIALIRPA